MKTLQDIGFPMTDGALSHVPPAALAQALINQACAYHGHHKSLRDVPCWVFQELGLGMDYSFQFVLVQFPDDRTGARLQATVITNAQAYRLIGQYQLRHDPYYLPKEVESHALHGGGAR